MCRKDRFSNIAFSAAHKSVQRYKHGAIATKNGKVICEGHNDGMRTKVLNNYRSCAHAEMVVAVKIIKMLKKKYGKNYKNYTSKYTIWVVRKSMHNSNEKNLKMYESKPCYYCTKDLLKEGFDKIGYSNEDGEIVIDRLKDIDTSKLHKSVLQLQTEEFY
jgi:deoxycytidylate deaminase